MQDSAKQQGFAPLKNSAPLKKTPLTMPAGPSIGSDRTPMGPMSINRSPVVNSIKSKLLGKKPPIGSSDLTSSYRKPVGGMSTPGPSLTASFRQKLRKEAPETLKPPSASGFSEPSLYRNAAQKFKKLGHWATE